MSRTSTIRVLQLGSPTGLYGAERWILALVKHLDPVKIESRVGVIKDEPGLDAPLCQEAAKLGFSTVLFEAQGKVNLGVIDMIRRYLVEEKIDILHTHFYKTDIIGYGATRGTGCKIVSTPHGWSKKMDFKLWCYEMLDRLVFPFMDGVAPLSEDLYLPLRRIPGLARKLHFIRNGVDLSEITGWREIAPELAERKQAGHFILGYIGQLIPRKGLDTLLLALAEIRQRPWTLYLVGDGPQKEELVKLARGYDLAERVLFMGFRSDRLAFLRGFDAFVLPSRLEGIPRCLMEAMGAEIPIIASNIPGCNDLIQDQQTGLLFEVDNPSMLARALQSMMESGGLREKLARQANKHVHEHYSAARMAKEYEALFAQLVRGSAP